MRDSEIGALGAAFVGGSILGEHLGNASNQRYLEGDGKGGQPAEGGRTWPGDCACDTNNEITCGWPLRPPDDDD